MFGGVWSKEENRTGKERLRMVGRVYSKEENRTRKER